MATIRIGDSLALEVLSANADARSLLAKYLKNPHAALRAGAAFKAQLEKDLQLVTTGVSGFGPTTDGKVLLSYHKMAGRELGIDVGAAAGPSLTFGKKDLLALLFGRPRSPGSRIEEELVASGISEERLETITATMEAGLSRKLALELAGSFSALREDEAAFLYEVDLARLDGVGDAR
jgi:hypothetical protein